MSNGESEQVQRRECPACREMIVVGAKVCRFCKTSFDAAGEPLLGERAPLPESKGDATGGLIPYKNTSALIAYYCGVFSLIPCFAIGIAALILGIKGLKYAKANPEAKGKVHAWIGIIAGGFFGVVYLLLNILMVVGMIVNRGR